MMLINLFFLTLGIFSSLHSNADAVSSKRVIDLNNQGIEFLKKENNRSAQEKFTEALSAAPFSAALQINLGLSLDAGGNLEQAQKAYESVPSLTEDKTDRFVANFNLGEIAGRQKKVDEALAHYQKALEYDPNSVETKTNIELLVQQQQGGGKSDKNDKNKDDQKDDKNKDDKKDDKDQDQKKDSDGKDKDKKDDPKKYQNNKPQPKEFKSEQLDKSDVKKILEELNRQEQRVRAEYNRKQVKEKSLEKDW